MKLALADGKARSLLSTIVLSALLLVYSNTDAWLERRRKRTSPDRVNLRHLVVLGFVVAWGWAERLTPRELGIHLTGLGRSLRWGLAAGVVGCALVSTFFAFPVISREAVTHPDFRALSFRRCLWMLGGQLLLSTAVFEEVSFRGVLHAKLVRLVGPWRALAIGGVLFAAWHAVITWHNLRQSNLPRRAFTALYVGAMVNFCFAGLLFGLLRDRTGHLAGAILAHWLIVSNIVLSVARPHRPAV